MTLEEFVNEVEVLLQDHTNEVDISGPREESLIRKAEAFLEVAFPSSYREFLKRWGSLGFGPEEIYGITGESFERSSIPNGVWFTAQARRNVGLPTSLVVVVNCDGDQYYCIDTGQRNDDGESPVVVWDVTSRAVVATKSNSFNTFLLTHLRETTEILSGD